MLNTCLYYKVSNFFQLKQNHIIVTFQPSNEI